MTFLGRLLLLGSAALLAYQGGPVGKPQTLSPAEIWEGVLAAKGGRDRLHQIKSLAWASNSETSYSTAERYEFVMIFPDRYWSWEDHRPGRMGFGAEVWNALTRQHWIGRNGGAATAVPWDVTTERARLRMRRENQLVFLLETSFVAPTIQRATTIGERFELEGTAAGFVSLRYVIDRRSNLPVRITLTPEVSIPESGTTAVGVPVTYQIEGYASYGGVQLPSAITGLGALSYVVNPDLDARLFETPPHGVTTRDAWRHFLKK